MLDNLVVDFSYHENCADIVKTVVTIEKGFALVTFYREPTQPEIYGTEIYYHKRADLTDGHYYSRNYNRLKGLPQMYVKVVRTLIKEHKEKFENKLGRNYGFDVTL